MITILTEKDKSNERQGRTASDAAAADDAPSGDVGDSSESGDVDDAAPAVLQGREAALKKRRVNDRYTSTAKILRLHTSRLATASPP